MTDYSNPYGGNPYLQMPTQEAPDWRMVLANLATGIGTGISQGAASGQGWAAGLAPGIAYGNQLTGMQQQNAEQRAMKRWQLGLMAQEHQDKQQERELKRRQLALAAGQYAPTGLQAPPPSPQMGPVAAGGPAPNRDEFVQTMMPHALEVSNLTGLDPRLVIAQAALETGFGKAAPGNNYFGIKSHGRAGGQVLPTNEVGPAGEQYTLNQSFRTYADPGASARDYADFLKTNSRYQPVLGAQGLDAQIDAMARSGYATDPQYGAKLRQIAQGLPAGQQVAQAGGAPVVPQGDAIAGQGDAPVQPVQYAVPPAQPRAQVSDAPPTLTLPNQPTLSADDSARLQRLVLSGQPDKAEAEYKRIHDVQNQMRLKEYEQKYESWKHNRGQADKDAWRPLSKENAKMFGLDENKSWQQNIVTKKIEQVDGAQTVVNIDQKAEAEFGKEMGKMDAKRFGAIIEAEGTMNDMASKLGFALDQFKQTYTGPGAEAANQLNKILGAAGFEEAGKKANAADAAMAAVSQMKPHMRAPGSGASSDRDMDMYARALPNLLNLPDGNERIVRYFQKMADRATRIRELAQEHSEGGKVPLTRTGFDAEVKKLGPLFSEEERKELQELGQKKTSAPPPPPAGFTVGKPGVSNFGRDIPPPPPGFTVK
jgi:flagellum-specific peptidoglycan hydrolase FlgJ